MKTSTAIGIKDYSRMEEKNQPEFLNRELFKEQTEQLVKQIKAGQIDGEGLLISINAFIDEDIKTAMKTKDGFKKSFTLVEALINGHKRMKVFASRGLAIKVMNYIKETYGNKNDIQYTMTSV